MKRGVSGESFETNSRKDNDPTGEEESSDYKHVLMNGLGASALIKRDGNRKAVWLANV